MVSKNEILERLATVRTPDGADIVSANLVSDIYLSDGRVAFAISVPAEAAKDYEPVRAAAERAVKALPGVERAMVALTAETSERRSAAPSAPSGRPGLRMAPGGAARQARGAPQPTPGQAPQATPRPPHGGGPVPGIRRIVAVASGKGGVGKSTVAVNVAVAMHELGWRVGVLDADVYGPSVPTLLGLAEKKPESIGGRVLRPLEAHGVKAMSIGFLIPPDSAIVWRGPMVSSALSQLLREVEWGELDCLVIDMPPGTGDVQLSLAQQAPLTGAVIVATPQDLALIDARRASAMFAKVMVPVLGLVENMSHYVCPNCGHRADIFSSGGGRTEAERENLPFLGEVPLHIAIREGSDAGRPVAATAPGTPEADAYLAIAAALIGELEHPAAGRKPYPKIVVEEEAAG